MNNKQTIRAQVRARFPGAEQRATESEAICRHILDWPVWQSAETVGLYIPMRREADVGPLLDAALRAGKKVVLPRVDAPGCMTLRSIASREELVPGMYGIPEPPADAPMISAEELQLLLVPLEALDPFGTRLGKGGGYYDRLLPQLRCPAPGVLLQHQWVEHVPREPWDVPLACAVDSEGIKHFEGMKNQ